MPDTTFMTVVTMDRLLIGFCLAALLFVSACAEREAPPSGPLFQLVTSGELPTTGKSYGATWADVDQDGRLDFLLGHHGHGVGLYLNGPGMHLVRQDSCAFLPCENIDQHGTAACDFDGDGDWELYLTVGADRGKGQGANEMWTLYDDRVYRNVLPPEHFTADLDGRGRGATWVRLDGDRFPELVVLNYRSPARLFRYDGRDWTDLSRFINSRPDTAQTGKKPPKGTGRWLTVAVPADFDRDGFTDLFLAGDGYFLMHNLGSDGLRDETIDAGLPQQKLGLMHAAAGDVDNDGDPDLLLVHRWQDGVEVWLNESAGGQLRFRQGPDLRHLVFQPELDSAVLADFDNDGILDLYVMMQDRMKNNRPNLVARGLGNGDFAPVSDEWGGLGAVEALPRGAWPVDLDFDGDLDLMLIHGKEDFPDRTGIAVLYENTTRNRGVTVTLAARDRAPHGMGAEIILETGNGKQTRQVQSTISHLNSTVLPVHFGLGQDKGPAHLSVHWPDGQWQQVVLPPKHASYLITQGEKAPKPIIDIPSQ